MNKHDDEQWLAALSGKPYEHAAPETNAQAIAIREAMLIRRQAIEETSNQTSPKEFERLRARLLREGLIKKSKTENKRAWRGTFLGWLADHFLSKDGRINTLPVWSLSANLVLVSAVAILMITSDDSHKERDVLRNSVHTTIITEDPATYLTEIAIDFETIKARYVVRSKQNGNIELLVESNDRVIEYLTERRVFPEIVDGLIEIRIESDDDK